MYRLGLLGLDLWRQDLMFGSCFNKAAVASAWVSVSPVASPWVCADAGRVSGVLLLLMQL